MPASPETVATYLSAIAAEGAKFSTVRRRVAAIKFAHEAADRESPTSSRLVRSTLAGIRRTIGVRQVKKAPASAGRLVEIIRLRPTTLTGMRDRAMLLLGFAGAFRRSELVALRVEDLQEAAGGMRVTIRRSKTDQDGAGQEIAIARGDDHCPVLAVKAWMQPAGITEGYVFRPFARNGRVLERPLSARAVTNLVKAYAERAGFRVEDFSGHSLRAGAVTTAASRAYSDTGVPLSYKEARAILRHAYLAMAAKSTAWSAAALFNGTRRDQYPVFILW